MSKSHIGMSLMTWKHTDSCLRGNSDWFLWSLENHDLFLASKLEMLFSTFADVIVQEEMFMPFKRSEDKQIGSRAMAGYSAIF